VPLLHVCGTGQPQRPEKLQSSTPSALQVPPDATGQQVPTGQVETHCCEVGSQQPFPQVAWQRVVTLSQHKPAEQVATH